MKKLLLSGLLLASTFIVQAQKTDTVSVSSKNSALGGNNELKLNLIMSIAGIPEINYERIISDDMSIGIAVIVGLEKETDYKFGIIPNYRVYFGGKRANGFFIEGNAAVISSRGDNYVAYTSYPPTFPPISKTYTNFGLGAAAGAKFLTKNGFVGEIYLGVGRLFGNNFIEAYPRAGITIGKRF